MGKKSKTDINNIEIESDGSTVDILEQAAAFLGLFLPKTLAKRFIALILLCGRQASPSRLPQDFPGCLKEAYGHCTNNCPRRKSLE